MSLFSVEESSKLTDSLLSAKEIKEIPQIIVLTTEIKNIGKYNKPAYSFTAIRPVCEITRVVTRTVTVVKQTESKAVYMFCITFPTKSPFEKTVLATLIYFL